MYSFIGRISYSIYVWQYVVFGVMRRYIPTGGEVDTYILDFAVALFCVVPVAAVSYYVIERPFLELRVKYLKRSEGERAP